MSMKKVTAITAGLFLLMAILLHASAQAYGKFSSTPNQDAENGLETTSVSLRHLALGLFVLLGLQQGTTQGIAMASVLLVFYFYMSERRQA